MRHGVDMQSQNMTLLHLKLLLRLYCNKWNKHSAAPNWQTLRNEMQRFLIKANTIVARTEMHHKSLSSRFRKRVKIRKWEHCESHLGQNSFRLRFETRNVVTTFHNLPHLPSIQGYTMLKPGQCGALPFRFQCLRCLQFNFNCLPIVFDVRRCTMSVQCSAESPASGGRAFSHSMLLSSGWTFSRCSEAGLKLDWESRTCEVPSSLMRSLCATTMPSIIQPLSLGHWSGHLA